MSCFIIVGTTKACVTRSRSTASSHRVASNWRSTTSLRPVNIVVITLVAPAMW